MSDLWVHPAFVLILGALLVPVVPSRLLKPWLFLVPLLAFLRITTLTTGSYGHIQFLDWTLVFGRVDPLSQVFGYIMGLMAIIGSLYALHVQDRTQHMASWVYAGSALGAIYAGDFLTLFLFWELMAFSSVFLVWLRRRPESLAAGFRYLLVHVAGGLALLAGILLHCAGKGGDWSFNLFDVAHPTAATWLVMAGSRALSV
jgi:multicomponent Na+:H+ antiporter subunit D